MKLYNKSFALYAITILCVGAQASVILFESSSGNGQFSNTTLLPAGCGNYVTSTSQGAFRYSLLGGITPNISTVYNLPTSQIRTWTTSFGDLLNICYATETQKFSFKLVAATGYNVVLNGFDMGVWPNLSYTINYVKVLDGSGAELYSALNPLINSVGATHTHFSFTNLSSSSLTIVYDSTNVDGDDVGIDNIAFSQAAVSGSFVQFNVKLNGWVGTSMPYASVRVDNGSYSMMPLYGSGNVAIAAMTIPYGAHTIRIKPQGFLAQQVSFNVSTPTSSVNLNGPTGIGLLSGDLDDNNLVDDSDLLLVINHFLQMAPSDIFDTNGDDILDDTDLLNVINNFLDSGAI